jgi:MarR family transcriptional regulator, transcriptional regulator for hemolysin
MDSAMDTRDDLPFLLHDVARLMRTKFDQRSRRMWGMTRAQSVILLKLSRQPGLCQNELAAILEVEPISVARLIDRLEAGGLVERRPDPSDRRMHRLHLLPASEPILAQIAEFRAGSIKQFREGISEADWGAAVRVLQLMKDRLINDVVAPEATEAGE